MVIDIPQIVRPCFQLCQAADRLEVSGFEVDLGQSQHFCEDCGCTAPSSCQPCVQISLHRTTEYEIQASITEFMTWKQNHTVGALSIASWVGWSNNLAVVVHVEGIDMRSRHTSTSPHGLDGRKTRNANPDRQIQKRPHGKPWLGKGAVPSGDYQGAAPPGWSS